MSWHRKYTIDFFIRGRSAMIIHMKFTLYSLKTLTVSKLQFQNSLFSKDQTIYNSPHPRVGHSSEACHHVHTGFATRGS